MLDGIRNIAQDARHCKLNDNPQAYRTYLEELSARISPRRIQELLERGANASIERRNLQQALRMLRKASIAASRGNSSRCIRMVRLALEAVGHDKQAVRGLLFAHDLSFTIIPKAQTLPLLPASTATVLAPIGWSNSSSTR